MHCGRTKPQFVAGTSGEETDTALHLEEGILSTVPLKTSGPFLSGSLHPGQCEVGDTFCLVRCSQP